MKKILLMIVMMIMSMSSFARAKMFGAKSGYIEYRMTGMETGTKKMWFDNYGEYIRIETKSVVTVDIGVDVPSEDKYIIEITNPDGVYIANMLTKEGSKFDSFLGFERPEEALNKLEMDKLGKEMLENMGGKIVGKETILGKSTEIVELIGIKSWYYENLSLKMQGEVMGQKIEEIAVRFDENIKIDKNLFETPEGIVYIDMYEELKMLDDTRVEMKYSIEEFKKSIEDINIEGYDKIFIQDTGEGYMAMYMSEEGKQLIIGATPLEEGMIESENEVEKNQFRMIEVDGKEAYINKSIEEGIEINSMVVSDYDKGIIQSISVIEKNYSENDFRNVYSQIK